jgi:N-acetylneuraminate synthase
MTLVIGSRTVGDASPCFIIAEVAQAHDGSLGAAHAYVDAAVKAGVDGVKFQTHIASAESTPGEPFRIKFSRQDATRYDYWKRMEFTEVQWAGLAEHCRETGVLFLSSPFSNQAVELLQRIGVPAWKVGSGETNNLPMLEKMKATGKPVLLSSGMSGWQELDRAIETIGRDRCAVMQCTTSYPCPPEKWGLNVIGELKSRYPGVPIGYSDHSGVEFSGLAAVSLGAKLLEVHLVFSKESFGPDTSSSLTPEGLASLVTGVRQIERALQHPVDKDAAERELGDLKRIFGKSLVAAHALGAGQVLAETDIALKKPGTGIPAARLRAVVGRRLRRQVPEDALLAEEDLE